MQRRTDIERGAQTGVREKSNFDDCPFAPKFEAHHALPAGRFYYRPFALRWRKSKWFRFGTRRIAQFKKGGSPTTSGSEVAGPSDRVRTSFSNGPAAFTPKTRPPASSYPLYDVFIERH